MKTVERFLLENKAWAEDKIIGEPRFFERLADTQTPEVLWIGCSGSRVPPEIIVNAEPGELFVHRNIANQFLTTDFNSLSVLQYAVDVLKVSHIIICGHYNCGSIQSAMFKQRHELALVNKWLKPVRDLQRLHACELEALADPTERLRYLVELNLAEQIRNLANTSIIQQAWRQDARPSLHGWVYDVRDGLLKELIRLDHRTPMAGLYQYED